MAYASALVVKLRICSKVVAYTHMDHRTSLEGVQERGEEGEEVEPAQLGRAELRYLLKKLEMKINELVGKCNGGVQDLIFLGRVRLFQKEGRDG